jgi:hypothetical protein
LSGVKLQTSDKGFTASLAKFSVAKTGCCQGQTS